LAFSFVPPAAVMTSITQVGRGSKSILRAPERILRREIWCGTAKPDRGTAGSRRQATYIHDETLGPMVMRMASFFPFQATYYLNGHSFIEQELKRNKIDFRKNDKRSWPSTISKRCKGLPIGSPAR
jgi:hypothetical protein